MPDRRLGVTIPPKRKDPRVDSPEPFPAVIPPQTQVPVEPAPLSRRESWSSSLKPSRWAVNAALLLVAGGGAGAGVITLNKQSPASPPVASEAVSQAAFEAEKAERIRTTDILRQAVKRQSGFEDEVGTALATGPRCILSKLGNQTVVVCSSYKLRGVPERAAIVVSESLDPPTYRVELDGQEMPQRPVVP